MECDGQQLNPLESFYGPIPPLGFCMTSLRAVWNSQNTQMGLDWMAYLWPLGVGGTFWLFIFTLNRAKNWFNSIFNSKLNQKYSFKKLFIQIGKINSKNYSIQNWIKNIHSNWKNNLSLRKQWKTCKMGSFFLKTHLLFIFLMNIALFWFIQKFIQ